MSLTNTVPEAAAAVRIPVTSRLFTENAKLLGQCPLQQAAANIGQDIRFGYLNATDFNSKTAYRISDDLAAMVDFIDYHHRWADAAAPLPENFAVILDPAARTAELEAGPKLLEFLRDQNLWLHSGDPADRN